MEEIAIAHNQSDRSKNCKIYSLNTWDMPNNKYIILFPLSYMSMIFILSSVPGDPAPDSFIKGILTVLTPTIQNLLHIPLYGLLALFWFSTLKRWPNAKRSSLFWTVAISTSFSILDEAHQYFVSGRYMSLTDIYLNITGVFFALGSYKFLLKRKIQTF